MSQRREQKNQMPVKVREGLVMCALEGMPWKPLVTLVGAISVLGMDRASLTQAEEKAGERRQQV